MTFFMRRSRLLLRLAALAALAYPSTALARQGASGQANTAVIAQVEKATEAIRGLHARRAVPVTMLDPAAFKRLVVHDFNRDTTAADIRDQVQPLELLGVLPPNSNLRRILEDEQANGVAAFYDPKVKRFFIPVRPGGLTLDDRVTVSHEYTHALQDQAFDLNRVRPDTEHAALHNSDRTLAQTALIEGDATVEMTLYAQSRFSASQYGEFQKEANAAARAAQAGDHTPRFLLDQLLFPYEQGALFEVGLLQRSLTGVDFSAVNRAFRRPPVSTQQILHPELYRQHPNAPAPDLAPPRVALPKGWRRVDSDVFGEYELGDLLAQRIAGSAARHVAAAWRADRYSLYDHGLDYLMAWRIHTGSPTGARALADALAQYLSRRYHSSLSLPHGKLAYATRDSSLALRLSGADILVVVASRAAIQHTVAHALATMH